MGRGCAVESNLSSARQIVSQDRHSGAHQTHAWTRLHEGSEAHRQSEGRAIAVPTRPGRSVENAVGRLGQP